MIVSTNIYAQQTEYLVSGYIKNCSIHNLMTFGQTNLEVYGTDIYQINVLGKTRLYFDQCIITEGYVNQNAIVILNNTKVLTEWEYGIIVHSGIVTLTNGNIQGTGYINNTVLINANVSKMVLKTVVVNNTGQIYISNFSCTLFTYNYAKVIINETDALRPNQAEYGGYFSGSTSLIGINSTFDFIYCTENSSLDLFGGCAVDGILLNSSNDVTIENCVISEFGWYTDTQTERKAEIFNSTIQKFYAPSSSKVDIINCSVDMLEEAISFQSGTNYLNSSGIFGTGIVLNSLNFSNTVISDRIYKYIEVGGETEVYINDLHTYFNAIVESGTLTIENSTLDSLQLRNDAIAYLNNCSTDDIGGFGSLLSMLFYPQAFLCSGNSHLYITNTIIYDGYLLMLMGTAQTTIERSVIYGIYIYQESRAIISDSELWMIVVSSASMLDYALNLLHSSTDTLSTIGWKY
jgi:hypothetical protein